MLVDIENSEISVVLVKRDNARMGPAVRGRKVERYAEVASVASKV